ncbi:MAG: efflux RND transporter periplasmic adaptor subunit [Peptococcaceae bacterium]|nr:efflux RND transporter periplasmic adaptor subunit [Peptococcaceae bacterium]
MNKRIAVAVVITLIVAVGLIYRYNSATSVAMTRVNLGSIQDLVSDTGYVQAAKKHDIYSEQSGTVGRLLIKTGQKVSKNQVIMIMENQDLAMNSQQLQIQLNQARGTVDSTKAALIKLGLDLSDIQEEFERSKALFLSGAISQVQLDFVKTGMDREMASFDALEKNLQTANEQVNSYERLLNISGEKEKDLTIKSIVDGIALQLPVESGQTVTAGTLLARIGVADELEVKAEILSDDVGQIKVGQKAKVTAPVLRGEILEGEIIEIYPQAEEKLSALGLIQRRVPIIIKLNKSGNLKPGYETKVTIVISSKEKVMLIPRESVFSGLDGKKRVMKVVEGKVVYTPVKTGLLDSKNIEITAGLSQEDQIIRDASTIVKENTRVKPLES